MTPNEHDYMERYIYQVIRRLPKAQREEVRMELEELIGDMYEDNGSMEDVLTQIGDPVEFAKQYQTDQQYMIGPEYYETYLWFVRVVIICTAVPIFAVSLISTLGEASVITSQNSAAILIRAIVEGITAGVTDLLVACCSAFGAVTLTFAIIERQKIRIDTKKSEKWTVKNLSQSSPNGSLNARIFTSDTKQWRDCSLFPVGRVRLRALHCEMSEVTPLAETVGYALSGIHHLVLLRAKSRYAYGESPLLQFRLERRLLAPVVRLRRTHDGEAERYLP